MALKKKMPISCNASDYHVPMDTWQVMYYMAFPCITWQPRSAAARARDYPHATAGSEFYIYNNWSMQWGLHPGNPPKKAPYM